MDLIIDAPEVCFRGYRLDTVSRVLHAPDGTPVGLSGRAYDVLAYLIQHRPRVVAKDELLAAVWPGRVVEENNLTQAISALRRAFGTVAGEHHFILTVPGRGYSFVAEVNFPDAAESGTTGGPDSGTSFVPASSPRRTLKGLTLALALALLVLAAVAWIWHRPARSTPAVAVLPFQTLGSRPADPMLELGMAETLITRLSMTTRLRILSLASTQALAHGGFDPLRAGATLDANYVVEGHLQQQADKLRITVRLLSLPDGKAIWAGSYDETPGNAFKAQDVISSALGSALAQHRTEPMPLAPCFGSNPEAYRAWLRGRYLLNRPNPLTIDAALAAFQQAIDLDPSCARAWAGVAATRRTMVMVADHDPRVEFPLADAAIDKALALNPESAEAWAAKGFNQFWYHWDWEASERSLRHAIRIDPNLVDAHFALAHLLNNTGRHAEATDEARRASELDPLSPLINTLVAWFVDDDANTREAEARLNRVLELEPDFWIARVDRGMFRLQAGDKDGALRDVSRAVNETGGNCRTLCYQALVYLQTGRPEDVRRILAELESRARTAYVLPSTLALLHLMLGEGEKALDLLEQGYRGGDIGLAFLTIWFRPLAGNPRYDALVRKMHLPQVKAAPAAGA